MSALPATERQKEYARELGIVFSDDITRSEISKLISEAVDAQDDKRYQELAQLDNRESEAWFVGKLSAWLSGTVDGPFLCATVLASASRTDE